MTEYRNIDNVIEDAAICIEITEYGNPIKWFQIPKHHEEVSLDTDKGYRMKVEVDWISESQKLIRGKTTQAYFHKNSKKCIAVGDSVGFSQKKVAVIHRSD